VKITFKLCKHSLFKQNNLLIILILLKDWSKKKFKKNSINFNETINDYIKSIDNEINFVAIYSILWKLIVVHKTEMDF